MVINLFPLKQEPDVTSSLGALLSCLLGESVLDLLGLFSGVLSLLAPAVVSPSRFCTVSSPANRWTH